MKEKIEFFQKLVMACEILSALAGVFCWPKIKYARIKAFVIYLVVIAVAEQTGWYLKHHNYKEQTSMLYAYFVIPLEFLFAYWFIYKFAESSSLKKLCIIFAAIGITGNIIEIAFFSKEKFFFSSLAYIIYALLLLILALIYLLHFAKSDKIITYRKYYSFWVCAAYLIYYLPTFPLYAFYNYLYTVSKDSFYIYWDIQMCLNALMYLLFFTGLIWTSKK